MLQKKNKKRILKGSVTVFALLLMFILAVTTIGIISVAAIERKASISTGNSTTAFQVAETGMEKTLQYFKSYFDTKLSDLDCRTKGIIVPMLDGSNCSANVGYVLNDISATDDNEIRFKTNDQTVNCGYATCNNLISSVKIIKSIGTTKQETRSIEEDVFLGATKLLLHLNGTNGTPPQFDDSSFYWNNHAVTTVGGVSVESEVNEKIKLGEGSANFDGTTGYLSVPGGTDGVDFNFGKGDFTIDWWEYRTGSGDAPALQRRSSSAGYPSFVAGLKLGPTTELGFYASSLVNCESSCWDIANNKSMGPIILDEWAHYAVVRKGNTFYTFQNGKQKATWPSSAAIYSTNNPLEIGRFTSGGDHYFQGYIDELRISKGVARWIGGTNEIKYFYPEDVTTEYWAD